MQLAIPTVTSATPCGRPPCATDCVTLRTLSSMTPGLSGEMWRSPSAIRFMSTRLATRKIPKVTRAFSRMPRMLRPAIPQMTPRMSPYSAMCPSGRKAVPLITALTVEMHAVRM